MRRLSLVVLAACLAAALAFSVSLFAAPKVAQASDASDIVWVARRYIGTDYGWYSCTRRYINCSCLTKRVFAKFGYDLPWSDDMQWKVGRRVSRSELRPGDLVFFEEYGPWWGITHMGIYSGYDYLIHASWYYDGVVETEMNSIRGYKGARRLRL
jgi:cell wall-associated NlpC family hydrolase